MIINNISEYLSHLNNVYNNFVNELLSIFNEDTFDQIIYPNKDCDGIILVVSNKIVGLEKIRREVINLLARYPDVKIFKITKTQT